LNTPANVQAHTALSHTCSHQKRHIAYAAKLQHITQLLVCLSAFAVTYSNYPQGADAAGLT